MILWDKKKKKQQIITKKKRRKRYDSRVVAGRMSRQIGEVDEGQWPWWMHTARQHNNACIQTAVEGLRLVRRRRRSVQRSLTTRLRRRVVDCLRPSFNPRATEGDRLPILLLLLLRLLTTTIVVYRVCYWHCATCARWLYYVHKYHVLLRRASYTREPQLKKRRSSWRIERRPCPRTVTTTATTVVFGHHNIPTHNYIFYALLTAAAAAVIRGITVFLYTALVVMYFVLSYLSSTLLHNILLLFVCNVLLYVI